jgi:uncharacterized protein YgfB (UPF0149 family)
MKGQYSAGLNDKAWLLLVTDDDNYHGDYDDDNDNHLLTLKEV